MVTKNRWKDKEVKTWAHEYLTVKSLMLLESILGVPHATLWWCFRHRLVHIDKILYNKVSKTLDKNRKGEHGSWVM